MKTGTYKIESGIPIPPKGTWGYCQNILRQMAINDSFLVQTVRERTAFMSAAARYKIKVTTRKLEQGGFRIWRVK